MVWGEHDNRFKELNSQLLRECSQLDWTGHAGHAVSGSHDPAFANPAEPTWVDEDDIMAVTAQSSGRTLRELAAGSTGSGVSTQVSADPRRAAAIAASARLASASTSPNNSRSASPDVNKDIRPAGVGVAAAQESPAAASSDASPGPEVAINPSADIASMGHRDPNTEEAEEAMRALGSMDFATQAADVTSSAQHTLQPNEQSVDQTVSRDGALATQQQQQQQQQASLQQGNGVEPAAQAGANMSHQPAATKTESSSTSSRPTSRLQEPGTSALEQATQAGLQHAAAGREAAQSSSPQDSNMADAGLSLQQMPAASEAQDDSDMSEYSADPAVQRYKQAEAAVLQLRLQAGIAGQQAALQTLAKILQVRP